MQELCEWQVARMRQYEWDPERQHIRVVREAGKTPQVTGVSLAVPHHYHFIEDAADLRPHGADERGSIGMGVVMEDVGRASRGG